MACEFQEGKIELTANMKFPADAPVTPAKLDDLRARIARLGVDMNAVDEQAVKGSGPGGQKVNKTSSGVLLRYVLGGPEPRQLVVKWARERQRSLNRFLALRELIDEIEVRVSPQTSRRLLEQAKIRKQKDRARRR
jgi:protein subunit release factor B